MDSDTGSVIYDDYDDISHRKKMAKILMSLNNYKNELDAYKKKCEHDKDVMRARVATYFPSGYRTRDLYRSASRRASMSAKSRRKSRRKSKRKSRK